MSTRINSILIFLVSMLMSVNCTENRQYERISDRELDRSSSELSVKETFFLRDAIWDGEFEAYVNKEKGLIQKGRIVVKMYIDENSIIHQSNAFIRPDGTQTDYEGSAKMKLEGTEILWVGDSTKDPNTGNVLENHRFNGYFKYDQAYIVEDYDELYPDGRKEHRHNDVHYLVLDEDEILMTGNVSVNGDFLVFSNTTLLRRKEVE